jgi:hypothetical protein
MLEVILIHLFKFGKHNIPHPDDQDGIIYRADGQVQIASDDLIRLRNIRTKDTGIQFDTRRGAGDMRNPNGQMKITRQGIMFGGPNNASKQVDSAQISAGRHVANSLNIVGMSSNKSAGTRRVDVWAENGMHVRSNHGLKVHGHGRETSYGSVNGGWSHMITNAPQFYMNKSLQVNGGVSSYHNKPLNMPHGANITRRTTINDQTTHIPLVVQSKVDSHIQLLAHNKPAESVYLINRNGGHFRLHSHGVGDTLHVNRDGHTFINSRNNSTPLHVQSAQDAHIRLTGRNNVNNSTYLINRNGGNFMVHQHGIGDVLQVLKNGRVRLNHNQAHLPNANDYSMEIFTPQQDRVKETSIRFHQGGRYWHQLRADNTGFKMTTGNGGGLSNLAVNSVNATTLNATANANVRGDMVFNGGNNWIIHTPNDNRHIMYIAPSTARNNQTWNWANQFRIESNGNVFGKKITTNHLNATEGVTLLKDTRNLNHPPSHYRARAKALGNGAKFDEFKDCSKIDLPSGYGTYAYVETIVPWVDTSGGTIKQTAYTDHAIFYRSSLNETNWNPWRLNTDTIIRKSE